MKTAIGRREFIGACVPGTAWGAAGKFRARSRQEALKWFKDAKFGMMPCYYLASLDGRHAFEQWKFKIPVKEMGEESGAIHRGEVQRQRAMRPGGVGRHEIRLLCGQALRGVLPVGTRSSRRSTA